MLHRVVIDAHGGKLPPFRAYQAALSRFGAKNSGNVNVELVACTRPRGARAPPR
jgi:hypothetical protein